MRISLDKILLSCFVLILITSFLLHIVPGLNYNFAFTTDQGRDMLDIRSIVVGKDPSLIGPTTSINGVFLGPFWYYFNVIPFLLGNGDPSFLVYWIIGWFLLAGFLLWKINYKNSPKFAFFSSSLFLLSSAIFYTSIFSLNANAMPFFTVFWFLSLFSALKYKNTKQTFLLGFICGLSLQIEAAFGILFFPFTILVLLFHKFKIKHLLLCTAGFLITLIPQVIFELRHNFLVSKNLINEITGHSTVLMNKLTLVDAAKQHLMDFISVPNGIIELPTPIPLIIFISATVFLTVKYTLLREKTSENSQTRQYFFISLFFIVFAYLFYLTYHYALKSWYLLGLYVPFILIIATFLTEIIDTKRKVISILIIIAVFISFSNAIRVQSLLSLSKDTQVVSTDPNGLKNEMSAIDWVYHKANGRGFKVFSYTPSVYDFTYQYVFWWYGTKQYGYQPDTISYLENQPEYITDNISYFNKRKALSDDYPTFLIIEQDKELPRRQQAWLGNFSKLCTTDSFTFPWKTEVRELHQCPLKINPI